ncbi:MAG: VOC family protein, partial [Candidatus Binatia bacterium]
MDKLRLDAVVHWSIPVNDLEAAEKFYGGILGLEHVGRLANTPMSCFKLGNHNILLCQRNDPIYRTVEQDGRLHHAFDVSPEMFDTACKLFHQLAI